MLRPAQAQSVQVVPEPDAPLTERWTWAQEQAAGESFWTGYLIPRRATGDGAVVASGNSVPQRATGDGVVVASGNTTVRVGGDRKERADAGGLTLRTLLSRTAGAAEAKTADSTTARALLLRWSADQKLQAVRAQPLTRPARLDGTPLYWLGRTDPASSVDWLAARYRAATTDDEREHLLAAVGAHRAPEQTLPVLRRVLNGDAPSEVRAAAAFWIGQQDTSEGLALLGQTARQDPSSEVRERAVFGINQVEGTASTDTLAGLARSASRMDIREKALFWLGQRASDRAAKALSTAAQESESTALQEKAVFAISRLPADQAVPRLIEIARTHPRLEVREKAIFWLGQSGDERAVEALTDLARGGQ